MSLALRHVRLERDAFVLEVDAVLDAPCTALLGASGSGKTSMLEAIAGLVRPVAGRIERDGEVLSDASSEVFVPARKRRIGYVPQDGALFPHLDVRTNLLYGARSAAREDRRESDGEAGLGRLARVLDIESLLERRIASLSGGERRRVALGRALLASPLLLLLDEPLTGLDRALKERAIELLARVRDELGIPMILVTHDDAEAEALATRILRLGSP